MHPERPGTTDALHQWANDLLTKSPEVLESEDIKGINRLAIELTASNERLDHLNRVLLGIRNVNQLIVTEDDPRRLIQRACVSLTETMGYHNAWIALLGGEAGSKMGLPNAGVMAAAGAKDFESEFQILRERLEQGDFTECMKHALKTAHTVVRSDPATDCPECPLHDAYCGRAGLVRRLDFDGVTYGILTASVPAAYADDTEEQDLFNEVAGDLAFALHKIATARSLEKNRRHLELVIEGSGMGTWEWNVQANTTVFNEQWAALVGYTLEELTPYDYTTWERLVHPEDLERARQALTDCVEGKTIDYNCEFRLKHKNGHWVWILDRGRVMTRDDAGTPLSLFGTHTDITTIKETEATLQESESRVRARLNVLLDPDGDLETLNLSDVIDCEQIQSLMNDFHALTNIGVAIVDLKGNILVGTGWQDVCVKFHRIHPDTAKNCRESDTLLASGVEPGTFKIYKCKNNMWDMATPIMIDEQHVGNLFLGQFLFDDEMPDLDVFREQARRYGFDEDAYLQAFRNIPRWSKQTVNAAMTFYCNLIGVISRLSLAHIKLARTSESLRLSEQRFRSFIENANDIVYALSPEGLFTYVSPNWLEFMGEPAQQAIGKSFESYVHPEDCHLCRAGLEKTFKNGTKQSNIEYRIRHHDGSWRWNISNGSLIRDASGIVTECVGIARDVTEAKQTEEAHEKLQAQFRQAQKMEAVGRLAGGVAHDFNNMLVVIIGHADLILEEMDPDHPFYADLVEIKKAGERSADLTRQLLAFARKQTVAPRVLNLNETVESMLKMLGRLIGEDIEMAFDPGEDVWPVMIDPGQIDQILANLCVNARDAIAGVGRVSIATDNVVFDEDFCRIHAGFVPGEYVKLAVSDNGCGMDAKTLSNIFEPFFTTKEQGKGTGLGLATVYGAVKQNKGFINVYSEPGLGTTFKIYLPRHRASAADLPKKLSEKPAGRCHETILLVEDEPAILEMTGMMLQREGYTVIKAKSPGEAIRRTNERTGTIDLLFSDVVMPEMNGRDLAENIQTLSPATKCPFTSGYTADVIAHQGVLDKGIHFIQKPFSRGSLLAKVREVLDQV
jgi:PAS domain S-box-containing protein